MSRTITLITHLFDGRDGTERTQHAFSEKESADAMIENYLDQVLRDDGVSAEYYLSAFAERPLADRLRAYKALYAWKRVDDNFIELDDRSALQIQRDIPLD